MPLLTLFTFGTNSKWYWLGGLLGPVYIRPLSTILKWSKPYQSALAMTNNTDNMGLQLMAGYNEFLFIKLQSGNQLKLKTAYSYFVSGF